MTLKKFIEFATLKIPDYLASLNLDEMSARDIKNAVDEQEPFEFLIRLGNSIMTYCEVRSPNIGLYACSIHNSIHTRGKNYPVKILLGVTNQAFESL